MPANGRGNPSGGALRCSKPGKNVPILHLFFAVLFLMSASCGGGAAVHYVQPEAKPGGDGSSWLSAFSHPQDALDAASPGDQVWIAKGSYGLREPEDRAVLVLKSGVSVFGGFKGSEQRLEDRDIAGSVTVLDGQGLANHVAAAIRVEGAVIDGITITGGKACGSCYESTTAGMTDGGGVFLSLSSLEIRLCRFLENEAAYKGGAIYMEGSDLLLTDCVFEDNAAQFGGALDSQGSSPIIVNCLFRGNRSSVSGGAVNSFESTPNFVNTVFSGNLSFYTGGAVLTNSSDSVFTNCTFNGNRCEKKSGGAVALYKGRALIRNSILWGDLSADSSEISSTYGDSKVLYSIIQGGYEGTENLDLPPDFLREGVWDGEDNWIQGDYALKGSSPAVDSGTAAGAPNFDFAGVLRPQEMAHDRGAYEFKAE